MPNELSAALIVHAYRQGIFPMADDDGTIRWYRPQCRAVFPLDAFHIPKSLAKTLRQGKFELRVNADFAGVMRGCAGRDETWISTGIIDAYTDLHRLGAAHSVEAWQDGRLVGGLYGVALGGAFMGESMFSHATDASKICLVYLVEHLKARGYVLLDSQLATEHLARFGQIEIPHHAYMRQLERALDLDATFVDP